MPYIKIKYTLSEWKPQNICLLLYYQKSRFKDSQKDCQREHIYRACFGTIERGCAEIIKKLNN